ncbi:hypothetical protein [Jiella sp. M17.18]|uniref:hypothetical protein n=1 Tax=Jiella sp. M17.18 TaxID=3234247 RepID=UPI0034DF41A8
MRGPTLDPQFDWIRAGLSDGLGRTAFCVSRSQQTLEFQAERLQASYAAVESARKLLRDTAVGGTAGSVTASREAATLRRNIGPENGRL